MSERDDDDDDDDDGLAWGEVISYEPSPDLGDVPVAVPIPSAPPAEAATSAPRATPIMVWATPRHGVKDPHLRTSMHVAATGNAYVT